MSALSDILRDRIVEHGPISVAEYMELALNHPEHGYYSKRDPFGLRGDFVTAPEISQIFGEMIGLWCAQMWSLMGGGAISLVELGPGRGTLMADLLRATKKVPEFHEHLSIHMVEMSPTLAHAQYTRLRYEHPRIEWLDSLEEVPPAKTIYLANEFFDALPIKQFVMTEDGVCERRVGWNAETQQLEFTLAPPGLQLAKSGQTIPSGTVMEQCPAARSMVRSMADRLASHGGAALVIDYGYLGDAHHDTLQAVRGHQFHPVLKEPGEADVTAHVDFTTLMQVAKDAGVGAHGLISQGEFLIRMGAELRGEMLLKASPPEVRAQIVAGLQRLIAPQQMGELFKVMALCADPRIEPPGFLA